MSDKKDFSKQRLSDFVAAGFRTKEHQRAPSSKNPPRFVEGVANFQREGIRHLRGILKGATF